MGRETYPKGGQAMLLKVAQIIFFMGVGVVLAFALFGVATLYRNLKGRGKDD